MLAGILSVVAAAGPELGGRKLTAESVGSADAAAELMSGASGHRRKLLICFVDCGVSGLSKG